MHEPAPGDLPAFRLGAMLWVAGMAGVLSLLLVPLPLSEGTVLPIPLWLVKLLSLIQPAQPQRLGRRRAPPKVALLRAPVFEALARRAPPAAALAPQVVPGVAAGVLGGAGLVAAGFLTPDALAGLAATFDPPLVARLLYGGITEELLVRWGLMTLFLWGAWRLFERGASVPSGRLACGAVVLSALAFGVLHLPIVWALADRVTGRVLAYVVGFNSAFGVLFGWLFWKYGLEAAMLAHALAHLVAFLAALAPGFPWGPATRLPHAAQHFGGKRKRSGSLGGSRSFSFCRDVRVGLSKRPQLRRVVR